MTVSNTELFRAADHSPTTTVCAGMIVSPRPKERLLPIQRAALWLGREYNLDPRYEKEQAREGKWQGLLGYSRRACVASQAVVQVS